MNVRANVPKVSGLYSDEKSEKEQSDVDEEGIAPDPDLDPDSLNEAFRFAAWSSVALVCDLFPPALTPISNDLMPIRLLSCSF